MPYITEQYRDLNSLMHEQKPGYGTNGYKHLESIMTLSERLGNTQDILDYGCGKSTLAINLGFHIQQYDPAIPKFAAEPRPADLVCCTDVLEHIEPYYVDEVLDHLQALTKKACFVVVSTVPANKTLPDGRNAHLIQKPAKWWMDRLWDRFELVNFQLLDVEFQAVLAKQSSRGK